MAGKPTVSPQLPNSVLLEAFGTDLEFSRELAPLTSFKTGGAARYFLTARSEADLMRAVKAARRLKIPLFIMGGGSNLLVSDDGFDGLVVKLDVLGLEVLGDTHLKVGAGESLMDTINFAAENSLAGLEFAAGIWGTVGGAIYGNAGAFGGEVGSVLERATLVDNSGDLREVEPSYFRFDYRHSYLKETREVVVTATFGLESGNREEIESRIHDILVQRDQRHPGELTAGCFFRNIPDDTQEHGKLPAGKLLEEAGAKDLSVGGARVYEKHANIIVNTGRATSKDIRQLADMMKQKVMNRFGIELQEEVQQLGPIQ
jgi:UDP-N-acetylmuramate dehydrogenase